MNSLLKSTLVVGAAVLSLSLFAAGPSSAMGLAGAATETAVSAMLAAETAPVATADVTSDATATIEQVNLRDWLERRRCKRECRNQPH